LLDATVRNISSSNEAIRCSFIFATGHYYIKVSHVFYGISYVTNNINISFINDVQILG
jgi:hypothetical protein